MGRKTASCNGVEARPSSAEVGLRRDSWSAIVKADNQVRTRGTPLAAKVPEITAWFWILKLLTTAMGEAASDYLLATSRNDGSSNEFQ
jgi:hypothetical protein